MSYSEAVLALAEHLAHHYYPDSLEVRAACVVIAESKHGPEGRLNTEDADRALSILDV